MVEAKIKVVVRRAPSKPVRVTSDSPIPLYFAAGGDAPTRIPCTQSAAILGEGSELLTGMTEEDILEYYHVDFTEEKVYKTVRKGYEITATWNLGKGTIHFDVKAVPSEVCRVTISTPGYEIYLGDKSGVRGTWKGRTPVTFDVDVKPTGVPGDLYCYKYITVVKDGNVIGYGEGAGFNLHKREGDVWHLDECEIYAFKDIAVGTATGITLKLKEICEVTISTPEYAINGTVTPFTEPIDAIRTREGGYEATWEITNTLFRGNVIPGCEKATLVFFRMPPEHWVLDEVKSAPCGDNFTYRGTATGITLTIGEAPPEYKKLTMTTNSPIPLLYCEKTPHPGMPWECWRMPTTMNYPLGVDISIALDADGKCKLVEVPGFKTGRRDKNFDVTITDTTCGAPTGRYVGTITVDIEAGTLNVNITDYPAITPKPVTITPSELRWTNGTYRASFAINNLVPSTKYTIGIRTNRDKIKRDVTGVSSYDITTNIPKVDLDREGYRISCEVYNLTIDDWETTETYVVPPYTIKGNVDIARSTIPTTIYLEESALFDMMVGNKGDREKEYAVVLTFKNVDSGEEFKFTPENTIRVPARGKGANRIAVVMPSSSIPPDREAQSFDLIYKLEIW